MKSLIVFAALLFGIVACETPAPATGSDTSTTTSMDSAGSRTTTPMRTDTTSKTTDTSKMRRDSM